MTNAKLSFFADKRTLKWPRSSVDAEGQRELAVPGRFSSQTKQEYEKYHLKKLVISYTVTPCYGTVITHCAYAVCYFRDVYPFIYFIIAMYVHHLRLYCILFRRLLFSKTNVALQLTKLCLKQVTTTAICERPTAWFSHRHRCQSIA